MLVLEAVLFITAVVGVIAIGIYKGRASVEESSDDASDYFLAGRGLTWWLVGLSLIAANISTEQFVGHVGFGGKLVGHGDRILRMVGGFDICWWWYSGFCRSFCLPDYILFLSFGSTSSVRGSFDDGDPSDRDFDFVVTSSVIYSGGEFVSEYYNDIPLLNNLSAVCWLISLFAAVYVFVGDLKACAWTDLVWGVALIVC
ncbi:hypothetical protein [Pelagicoccus sp. SDUM812002]|uniref:sodium:solute symporter family transporter n=1 Tax=Pelagicoccus sp. SDUM812002 TaxID=3041266 RepID=UPI00280DFC6A|nr:hypothetical protein [Pelagicoccus sp. SDUM812002]MDQ8184182.1 hypothetical protein [Pelagicoccus sp. SDUM812002]